MCNDYANHIPYDEYRRAFSELKIPVRFPDAAPNLEPRDDIWPTDTAPVIRATDEGPEFIQLPWGFPPGRPKGPPVINMRGENRRFAKGRCLVPVSWFYEFTGKKYPKTKWRFSKPGEEWFCIAGLWRPVENGAAFTMLTVDPGPDVAPYHNRQVVVLKRDDWSDWLDLTAPAEHLVTPSPARTLVVERAATGADEAEPSLAL
jgi:putative SOS response-associated peptidase YedK